MLVAAFTKPDIDWAALAPELILLGAAAITLVVGVFLPLRWRRPFCAVVSLLALVGAGIVAGILFGIDDEPSSLIRDSLRRDRLGELAQVFLCATGVLAVGVSYWQTRAPRAIDVPAHLSDDRERIAEYFTLLLAAVAGMAFFVQASTLMTLFLGLEWFSIALYVLTALAVDRLSSLEAGLKYLIVGSFGSAILLFGSAFVYGSTGELTFDGIAGAAPGTDRLFFVAGLAMILVGLAFKVSAAPFHMWTPDVYEGAPTPVTAFMSAATKIAALVLTLRLLTTAFPSEADLWTWGLAIIASISLVWGNLAALAQLDLKRLLAYSSVSHAGFLLMPIAAGNAIGGRALVFYLIPYAAMSLGAFAIVAVREREIGRAVTMETIGGLGWERPFLGATMAVFMFGFIGLPPSGLFLGKFYVFAAAYERGWTWLVIVGVIATVISVAYYLRVVLAMYATPELRLAPAGGSPPHDVPLTSAVFLTLVVTVGSLVFASPLIDLARHAAESLTYPF